MTANTTSSRSFRPALAVAVIAAACSLPVAAQTTGGTGGTGTTGTGTTTSTMAGDTRTTNGDNDRDWGWIGLLGLAGLLGLRRKSDVNVDRTRTNSPSTAGR
jgi:MYXO-CTERM domain-containing protein